jgi:hypothetical protein
MPGSGGGDRSISEHAYRMLLRVYPTGFRREYGAQMEQAFRDLCREAARRGGRVGLARLWVRVGLDLASSAIVERRRAKTKEIAVKDKMAWAVALTASFILVWLSLGVGIIGADGDPANMMYFGVLAVGIIGAIVARFRPHGMARALFATALAQASVAVIALIFGLGLPWSPPVEILALNGFFVGLFVGSALLFRHAARAQPPVGAGPEG